MGAPMTDPILSQLEALLATARREAYEQGYADAVKRIVAAAGGLDASLSAAKPSSVAAVEPEPAVRRTRAPRGSIERKVAEILQAAPDGLTVPEIEAASQDGEVPVKTASIRVALQRLMAQGQVVRNGRRWFFVSAAGAAAMEPSDDELPDTTEELEEADDAAMAEPAY